MPKSGVNEMVSRLSSNFLIWLIKDRKVEPSRKVFLEKSKVPDEFQNMLWKIVNELKDEGLVVQLRRYGSSERQQCDFDLTPLALDYAEEYKVKGVPYIDSLFGLFREEADCGIDKICPDITVKLSSVYSNMDSDNPEDWANAVHSCRRILVDLADVLYPPQEEPIMIGGKTVKVGPEQYINRLVQFIAGQAGSKTYRDVVGADLSSIGMRLDAINDAVCKGTHTEISKDEASRYIIHTYMLISDIVALADKE